MNKYLIHFAKIIVIISALYLWPSCEKKDNDPPASGNDSTANDTTPLKGWVVSTLAGSNVSGSVNGVGTQARFTSPNDITQDINGELYVLEANNRRIRKVYPEGNVTTFVTEDSSKGVYIGNIGYLLSDGYSRFYYAYNDNHIRMLTANGGAVFTGSATQKGWMDGPPTSALFQRALSIARDGQGNLYVADLYRQNFFYLRKITPAGYVSTITLNDQTGISDNSTGTTPYFTLAADSAGNVYYTAGAYNVIKKVDSKGNVSLLAGSTTTGFKDGKGKDAQFKGLIDMDVDNTGNVWVCDLNNHAIRRVEPDGTVTTIAGNGTAGYVNGQGEKARFNMPYGITINKNGTAYVVEANNHTVRKIEFRQ